MRVSDFLSLWYITYCIRRQGQGCPKQEKVLTNEHTTLRRHAAALHSVCFCFHLHFTLAYICILASLPKVVQVKQLQFHAT